MCPLINVYLLNDIARCTIDHIPKTFFKRRKVHGFAIGRNRHSIATTFKYFFPNKFVSCKVYALQRFNGADKNTVEWNAHSNAFYIGTVSYTHLRAHETPEHLVCRLLLE